MGAARSLFLRPSLQFPVLEHGGSGRSQASTPGRSPALWFVCCVAPESSLTSLCWNFTEDVRIMIGSS